MHITTRNVNSAFKEIVTGIHSGTIPTEVGPSRYGEVFVIEEPLTLTYERPLERVLFSAARDVNPFSLLYEALFLLVGREDVSPLAYYTPRFKEFSDDGKVLNDAYGYRWRHARTTLGDDSVGPDNFEYDQLKIIIDHLKKNPWSRRAVLSMWNVEDDLLKIDKSKAVACNLSCCFAVEKGTCLGCEGRRVSDDPNIVCAQCGGMPHEQPRFLNLTVFNRSNDLVWGTLAANQMTFSVLLEYVAAHLGLGVGKYHQISANAHAYRRYWEAEKWLTEYDPKWLCNRCTKANFREYVSLPRKCDGCEREVMLYRRNSVEPYKAGDLKTIPLVKDPAIFDGEMSRFVETHRDGGHTFGHFDKDNYTEPFLQTVAKPMMWAFHCHKDREYASALAWCDRIAADDWRIAATAWVKRREANYRAKMEEVAK